jgi:hypothetical protein
MRFWHARSFRRLVLHGSAEVTLRRSEVTLVQGDVGQLEPEPLHLGPVALAGGGGPLRVRLVLEDLATDERQRLLEPSSSRDQPTAVGCVGVADQAVEAVQVEPHPVDGQPIGLGLGDHDRRRRGQSLPQVAAEHRHVVLQRRHRMPRRPRSPEPVDQALLGDRVTPSSDEELEQLLGLAATEGTRACRRDVVTDLERPEDEDLDVAAHVRVHLRPVVPRRSVVGTRAPVWPRVDNTRIGTRPGW